MLDFLRRSFRRRSLERMRAAVGGPDARELPGVPGRVHVRDTMLFDDSPQRIADYLRAGRSAVECIERALAAEDRKLADVAALLDFGCGYGRVLRHLVQQVRPSRVTVCDVDSEAVAFCTAEFGVAGVVSSWNIEEIAVGTHELVWSGSVLTHFAEQPGKTMLRKLGEAIRPGGVLVFSIHGQYSLDMLDTFYGKAYAQSASEIRREVAERGFAFRPYGSQEPGAPEIYGTAWHSATYLEGTMRELFGDDFRLSLWTPQGWDFHHDVLSFARRS